MIRARDLCFRYEDAEVDAVSGISFHLGPGQILGIAGPEGSGRTSLFRLLNGTAPGFFPGDISGELSVAGMEPARVGHARLGTLVASIFDDPDAQIVSLTVEEEVGFALTQRGLSHEEIGQRVRQALETVGLAGFAHRSTSSLSGGQKQRLVTASVIALKPHVLLVDEGTSALDPEGAREFFSILHELSRLEGLTVVVVERDLGLLFEHCGRICLLDGGKLAFQGSARELAQELDTIRRLGLRLPAWLALCEELRRRGLLRSELPCRESEAIELLMALSRGRESA